MRQAKKMNHEDFYQPKMRRRRQKRRCRVDDEKRSVGGI